jgi:hypothetical protein
MNGKRILVVWCLSSGCLTLPGGDAPATGIYSVDSTLESSTCVAAGGGGTVGLQAFADFSDGKQVVQVPDVTGPSGLQDFVVFVMQSGAGTIEGTLCGASLSRSATITSQGVDGLALQETLTWSGVAQADAGCAESAALPAADCTTVRDLQYTLVQACPSPLRTISQPDGTLSCYAPDGGTD